MRAGELRHRIIIEKKAEGGNTYGEVTASWSSNIGAWARISPLRGSQFFASKQVQADMSHKITMRYATLAASTAIRPGYCRVKFGDRTFTINSVINVDERNIYLDLMCSEEL